MPTNSIIQGAITDEVIPPIIGGSDSRDETQTPEERFVAIVERIEESLDNKSDISHDHDTRYYTQEYSDTRFEELEDIDPYAPIGITNSTVPETVMNTAEAGKIYIWSVTAAAAYTPGVKEGNWTFFLYRHPAVSSRHWLFFAFNAADINSPCIYKYNTIQNRWARFTGSFI